MPAWPPCLPTISSPHRLPLLSIHSRRSAWCHAHCRAPIIQFQAPYSPVFSTDSASPHRPKPNNPLARNAPTLAPERLIDIISHRFQRLHRCYSRLQRSLGEADNHQLIRIPTIKIICEICEICEKSPYHRPNKSVRNPLTAAVTNNL